MKLLPTSCFHSRAVTGANQMMTEQKGGEDLSLDDTFWVLNSSVHGISFFQLSEPEYPF